MPRIKIAEGFKVAAGPTGKQRALAAALGSGVSNFATGTIASPFLFASEKRRFSAEELKRDPKGHLKQIYGREALGKGLALAGVSMLGGGIREGVQARVERRLAKLANGDMLAYYQDLARRARGGDKAAILALARRRRKEREKKATPADSSMGHSGDLLRVSAPVSAPVGPETKVKPRDLARRRSSRRKVADDEAEERTGPQPTYAAKGSTEREQRERFIRSRASRKVATEKGMAAGAATGAAVGVGAAAMGEALGSILTRRGRPGGSPLRGALIGAGSTLAGGAIGEALTRRKKASEVGIMAYQRDPGELPESKRPPRPKGRLARMFGTRMSGAHALHRRARRQEDEWMAENGECIEVGRRPGLIDALRDVAGVEGDQVLSRAEVAKLVAERRQAKSSAYGRRREKREAKEHVHTHAPDDLVEIYRVFEQLLENPAYRFFQVVG